MRGLGWMIPPAFINDRLDDSSPAISSRCSSHHPCDPLFGVVEAWPTMVSYYEAAGKKSDTVAATGPLHGALPSGPAISASGAYGTCTESYGVPW